MKRRFFAVFAVLLVLMLATCDLIEQPLTTGGGLASPDGQPMVSLTISVGSRVKSRSLTLQQAVDGVDYYEVVFKSPSSGLLYQVDWDGTGTKSLTIPIGNYTGEENAVVFAGDGTTKTLLAIGVITHCNNQDNPGTDPVGLITRNTTEVTFELKPLENNITKTIHNTTFKIIGPTEFGSYGEKSYATDDLYSLATPNTPETDETPSYPVFSIPPGGYSNPGGNTYGPDPEYLKKNIVGSYKVLNPYFAGRHLETLTVSSTGYTDDSHSGASIDVNHPASSIEVDSQGNGDFNFVINVSGLANGATGLSKVWIEAKVYAFGTTAETGTPIEWTIIGGTNNSDPDKGPSADDLGGAVILAVGLHQPVLNTADINVGKPNFQ